MSMNLPAAIAEAVTAWFAENGRPLPWRGEPDPYRVWLSEIMLQQTRVESVIPYYRRFLEAFPDIPSLAEAEDGRLLKLWEGLGYYSRARNLKKAARVLVESYGGALPPDVRLLRSLPGIGDYTAGAVASIAFGLPEPAVDGNVLRVTSRIARWGGDVTLPAAKREAAEALRRIYPGGRAAALMTEGLMELGEVICVPVRLGGEPRCSACPVRGLCEAAARGEAGAYPVRSARGERRIEERTVFLLRASDGRFLLRRRPADGLLGGMWEFPSVGGICPEDGTSPAEAAETILPGARPLSFVPLGSAKHLFTHVEWRMKGILAELGQSGDAFSLAAPEEGGPVFAAPEEIERTYAVPAAFRAWKKYAAPPARTGRPERPGRRGRSGKREARGNISDRRIVHMKTISFRPGEWEGAGLRYAYNRRFEDRPVFRQEEDCIVNGESAVRPGDYDYMGLLCPDAQEPGASVTVRCSFEDLAAPMLVLSMENAAEGENLITAEYYEIVIWRNGLNVWRHFEEDGKPVHYLTLGATFPLEAGAKAIHTLSARAEEKRLLIDLDGREFSLFLHDLTHPLTFGYAACEGFCRLYEMTIEEKGEAKG